MNRLVDFAVGVLWPDTSDLGAKVVAAIMRRGNRGTADSMKTPRPYGPQ